jgi:hypothetical protein
MLALGMGLEFAGQAGNDRNECPRSEETTEPVDPAHRLLPCPHSESKREDRATDLVCGGAIGLGRKSPPSESEQQRRVRELRNREAFGPALLATTPKLGNGHHAHVRTPKVGREGLGFRIRKLESGGRFASNAAKALSINDTARLDFKSENGVQLVEEGAATGTLPGSVRARLITSGSVRKLALCVNIHPCRLTHQGRGATIPYPQNHAKW